MKQYFQNIYYGLYTIMVGMRVTFKHLFVPSVTIQYPDVRLKLPERERNRLYVNMDDCIGCDQCARACPVSCITIETAKGLPTEDLGKTSNGKKKALWVTKFDIDIAKCCFCQLCVFPCPTECIYMTDVFEFSEYDRNKLVYDFVTLTPEERVEKKLNAEKAEAEKAAAKAAAAATPKAPPVPKPAVTPPVVPAEPKNEAPKVEPIQPDALKVETPKAPVNSEVPRTDALKNNDEMAEG